jgi:hypothetical protein
LNTSFDYLSETGQVIAIWLAAETTAGYLLFKQMAGFLQFIYENKKPDYETKTVSDTVFTIFFHSRGRQPALWF